ncbi:hypothetical protein [Streptosporangium sp. NPDC049644]|uniref:hypothetical protein n=1 Tax=Streptosporangium sp. NPDC049644 TaxID=3155507 RepID=UPI00343AE719
MITAAPREASSGLVGEAEECDFAFTDLVMPVPEPRERGDGPGGGGGVLYRAVPVAVSARGGRWKRGSKNHGN